MIDLFNSNSRQYIGYLNTLMMPVAGLGLSGCTDDHYEESIRTVRDIETRQLESKLLDELSITTEGGLEVSLWASEDLLGDPVGINFDNKGRAWVATTTRRRTSMPNAGDVDHWTVDNLSWRSVEDMREFLHRELTPDKSEGND